MNNQRTAKVIKVLEGNIFHLQDKQSKNNVIVQLHPTPKKANPNYYSLLKQLSQSDVTYELAKKERGSKIKQQVQKATIFLNRKSISQLLQAQEGQPQKIVECTQSSVYQKEQIIEAYVMDVQCLRIKLYLLNENKYLIFYFSEFKLPKVEHTHPKQVWHKAYQYFKSLFLGFFVQVKVNGFENYRQQMNIYGQILKLHNGQDLKEKCLSDGYVQLSKNCQKYLNEYQRKKFQQIIQQSKKSKRGIWRQQQKANKGINQVMEQKYVQWEQWIKSKLKLTQIKNIQGQMKQFISELKKNNVGKNDPIKGRIILQTIISLFEDSTNDKNIGLLQQFIKSVVNTFVNLQISNISSMSSNVQNIDFLKYLNKLIIVVLLYVMENQKLGNKNKLMSIELEKIIKIVFKYCFIGNQTFHKKVFDKRKQSDFQKFQFDPAYLSGISSYSETSDMQQNEKNSKYNKAQKKIISAQTKIRINATLLLSSIFKNYTSIVQSHWQICVNSNILTKDFIQYLHKLKISMQPSKMTLQQKNHIVSLMRTNFGDYSLILLVFFQQNAKVKMNAINCIKNMIGNFQSRKLIDTTQAIYIQKLLHQTKSSFVPKSFIVFSALRNALYFMLFSLHHERNVLIIINTFKTLTQLCQQSTLIDKMGFLEGMGLLMSNYITPVLEFPWSNKELIELKCLCIEFLGALVNNQKKWDQMQTQYLMSTDEKNINLSLINIFDNQKKQQQNKQQYDRITTQITKYFKNMAKKYYAAIFYQIKNGVSVWSTVTSYYLKRPQDIFSSFIQEVFKCHFDQLSLMKTQISIPRKNIQAINKADSLFGPFLEEYLTIYSKITTNQNYIGLINIITYIPYQKWSQNSYIVPKQFLIHCFKSINNTEQIGPSNKKYPSLSALKQNSVVRLSLIKLLGYMSFCKQFQKQQYSTEAIRNLLNYSRIYKSPNSVIKITWGLSNWSNIQCFKEGLTLDQLKQYLDYMIRLSQSDKQKIASNCTRGIGFFLTNINKQFNLQLCQKAIIKNLLHSIIKVRTNSTKTLRMMVANNLFQKLQKQSPKCQQIISTLEQNILKNNYHLQTQTLLLIKDLGNPIKQNHMIKIYSHILHDLLSHTTMEYEFSEIRALKQLRKTVLQDMIKYPRYIAEGTQTRKDFYQTVQNFILDSQEQSLRKQAENSKILQRGFEKGQQALNTVFNIKKQKYDQQKTITTQFTMRGVQYQANQDDLQLLKQIKAVGKYLSQRQFQNQKQMWGFLAEMKIQGRNIILGKF